VAVAETVIVPETLALLAGAVIATTGGVVSGVVLLTVTVTLALVAEFPAVSVAIARSVWAALLAFVLSHDSVYGAAVTGAPKFPLSNWN